MMIESHRALLTYVEKLQKYNHIIEQAIASFYFFIFLSVSKLHSISPHKNQIMF